MSYGLDEALAARRADLDALDVVRNRYPKAEQVELPDGRLAWGSCAIEPTGFLLCAQADDDGLRDRGAVWICPYEMVGSVLVFALRPAWTPAARFFDRVQQRDPATFQKLLAMFGT